MNPLSPFFAWLARRRAARIHAAQARRAAIIEQQMKERKAKHRAWKYLEGEMMACKRAMLEAEIALRSPSLSKGA
jgi:hypothetical protein